MTATLSQILMGLGISVLVLVSTLGNLLVCYAVHIDSRLHRVENVFLVSLAVSDLLVAILVMPLAGLNDLTGRWIFGHNICDYWIATDIMCSTASIFNLCAISLDRYFHIKDPFRYTYLVTKKVVVWAVLIIWTISAGISALPILLGLHRSSNSTNPCTCILEPTQTFAIISTILSFCIPCVVMISIYSRLYVYSRQQQRRIAQLYPSSIYQRSKSAVTIGVIMGIFLICWTPFFANNLLAAINGSMASPDLFKWFSWLGYSNSMFDPIVYSVLNSDIKRAFRMILKRTISESFSISSTRETTESTH